MLPTRTRCPVKFAKDVNSPANLQSSQIKVPTIGPVDPITYLRDQLAAATKLCEDILRDADVINP